MRIALPTWGLTIALSAFAVLSRGHEVILRLDLEEPAGSVGAKEGGVTFVAITSPAGPDALPVRLGVTLISRVEPCASDPKACDGSENFTRFDEDLGRTIYGCSDRIDNNGNGRIDADDPDCTGVQGWSFSLVSEPCFHFIAGTTRGTVADLNTRPPGLRDPEGSFEKSEVIPGRYGQTQGLVAACVLSFTKPISPPQVGESLILRVEGAVDLSGFLPGGATEPCLVRFLGPDEEICCSGEPVRTAVTVAGDTVNPSYCNLAIQGVLGPENLAETAIRVDVLHPRAAPGRRSGNEGASGTVVWTADVPLPPPGAVAVELGVFLESRLECPAATAACSGGESFFDPVSEVYGCGDGADNDGDGLVDAADPDCRGVEGWTIQLAADECFRLAPDTGPLGERGATTRGTAGDFNAAPPGMRDLYGGSFERTEILAPAETTGGRAGVVSTVVLSLTNPVILPPVSESLVLLVRGEVDASGLGAPGDLTPSCGVYVLAPWDEPLVSDPRSRVPTTVTAGGEILIPNRWSAAIQLAALGRRFVRGDTNDDGRADISDAITTLDGLYQSAVTLYCRDAADANDDGRLDISDAIYLLNFLFLSGPLPPAPFRDCGADPSPDDLGCGASAPCS